MRKDASVVDVVLMVVGLGQGQLVQDNSYLSGKGKSHVWSCSCNPPGIPSVKECG